MRTKWEVFGETIKIELKKGPLYLGDQPVYGYYDPDKKLVVVDKTLPLPMKTKVLYHEILHAVFIRLGIDKTGMSHDLHEIIVEQVAKFIFENFKPK